MDKNFQKKFKEKKCKLNNLNLPPPPIRCTLSPLTLNPYLEEEIYSPELIFDSNFESGNLFTAHKVNDFEYDLVL